MARNAELASYKLISHLKIFSYYGDFSDGPYSKKLWLIWQFTAI